VDADMEDEDLQVDKEVIEHEVQEKDKQSFKKVITTSMVDLWCKSIKENGSLNAVRSLMRGQHALMVTMRRMILWQSLV
jgi:nucleolar complex protein 2